MYIIVDDDEAGEPDPALVKPKTNKNKFARRSFVSAERWALTHKTCATVSGCRDCCGESASITMSEKTEIWAVNINI